MSNTLPLRIPLEGATNVRDLGGYPVSDQATTSTGRIFRADSLQRLTKSDVATLIELGVETVIDLRDEQEIAKWPNAPALIDAVSYHHVPLLAALAERGIVSNPPATLGEFYVLAARHCGTAFRDAFRIISEAEGAVLFHCTAGKDRTGMTAALLLGLAGVGRQHIVEDFSASGRFLEQAMAGLREYVRQMYGRAGREDFLSTHPSHIERFVDYIDVDRNGPESYLLDCGVSEAAIGRIRSRLIAE